MPFKITLDFSKVSISPTQLNCYGQALDKLLLTNIGNTLLIQQKNPAFNLSDKEQEKHSYFYYLSKISIEFNLTGKLYIILLIVYHTKNYCKFKINIKDTHDKKYAN